jgi:Flp pilus assembly protein TadG
MRRLRSDETGATAMIVALLLFALLGMAAFVVDLGDGMWERRMLQNSSDAAALAVAIDCAQGDCEDYDTTARDYADENNRRGAFVTEVVGPDGGPPTPSGGEVTVASVTGDLQEPGRLRQWFSSALGQEEGLATTASATAIWGSASDVDSTLPLVVSICDWERYTGLSFPPSQAELATLPTVDDLLVERPGPYYGTTLTPPDPTHPTGFAPPITIHDSNPEEEDKCTTSPGFSTKDGAKYPGGFGWIHATKGNCTYEIRLDEDGRQFASSKGGNLPDGKSCLTQNLGKPVILPIFVAFYGNVGNGEYEIITPAAFYLTGHANIPGAGGSTAGAQEACKSGAGAPYFPGTGNSPWCLTGHFVQRVVPGGGGVGANPGAGVMSVQLSN